MTQQAICKEITFLENLVLIQYKIAKQLKIMGISKHSADYSIAKTLQPGDNFIIEWRNTEITPTNFIEFIPKNFSMPYILQKINSR